MDEDFKTQALNSTLPSPSETLLSIRLLDFKTTLLEAVEELRLRRETENTYEDQISKIVVEKQDLEWQKQTLQLQMDTLHQQNKEAMAAFKKQLQARMFAMEEEKGKYQLAVETKEKEIDGLKETLKGLQISKYNLQKKLNDMDQKLQMQLTAKEEHNKKLNEVEKCYATIACQFGVIKGVHGKLEHSVQEAIQLNKKLTAVNKRQETEISNLKEELKKVTTDLIRSKVTSQYRVGEENINLATKEIQFQELQQKIRMEAAVIKKVQEENTHLKEENLEILSSLQHVQELLQRITQMNVRMESELNALKAEYQTLERDNELQREKAKENEEKFLNLQNEHEKALRTWKKDEENMRREIDTLKNELNSLKEVHRHLEDFPSQGNQHCEQVQDLQSGQEHSKDHEIQAIQKENECIIIKDGHFGYEGTEVKSTMDSSSIEEMQTEQNLQVLENSHKDEINVANPYGEKQREASPRNTLCTDTDLITQGQTSEPHVTESKEAENLEATHRMLLDENNANLEQKLQDSTEPLAAGPTQTKNVLSDSSDAVAASRKYMSQELNSSEQELCNTTDGLSSTWADKKLNTMQHNKSVLIPEAPKPDSEEVKNAGCEKSTNNHQAEELSCGILPCTNENSLTEYQKCGMLGNDNYVGNGLHKTEENLLNLSCLHRDKLPFKQLPIHAEDRNDDARNPDRHNALKGTALPATDACNPPDVSGDSASSNDATSDHSATLSLFSLCSPKLERGMNVDDPCSKQPEQNSTEQAGNATDTSTSITEALPPVKADGFEVTAHKKTPIDIISINKVIPCKKVSDDIQIHRIKNSHSLEINNSADNTLLKEKKDSLSSVVPGRKFSEGHLKELCSLPMRTSGNLVNISGRSSFDLSTSDKKAEKTPVYLNFLDLSSCSRVNQMRGQATCPSASKEPSLMKEKLPCIVENAKFTTRTQCQNLSETVDRREKGLGSPSFNRAADTSNASRIHPAPQGDPREGWNATAKTFYDSSFPTEHVKEGFTTLQHQQKSSHMTETASQSENVLRDEDSSSTHKSTIQNQIEEIEKILNLERLHSTRKRKYEGQ